jgi:hypothetical protein
MPLKKDRGEKARQKDEQGTAGDKSETNNAARWVWAARSQWPITGLPKFTVLPDMRQSACRKNGEINSGGGRA